MKKDMIIKNGYIYNIEDNKIEKKDILVVNGIISKIEDNLEGNYDEVIDATDKVVLPGFINSHIHFGEYYIKGYGGKLDTIEYINYAENFNNDNKDIQEELRISSSLICSYEAIKYGQTTLVGIRGWNCLEKMKVRLYMGYPLMKSNKLGKYLNDMFTNFESIKKTDLDTPYFFIHSLLTVDEEILKKVSSYINGKNIKVAIHMLETERERNIVREKYNMDPLELLDKYNLLNKNTLLIHCCYLNDNDIKLIKKNKCSISINPNSNLKLKNALPNIDKLKGINVCIGTDGVATNDSLNIMDSVKTIGLHSELNENELLKMITVNPAMYLGLKLGKVKVGYKADLNIYDLNNYKIVRKETFINNLIYSSNISPYYMLVNGEIIISKYKNKIYSDEDINSVRINKGITYKK